MKYKKLGASDLNVSQLCLGCMSFGDNKTNFLDWTLNYEDSEKIIKHALHHGINFFDTANTYSKGTSEQYLGKAIKKFAKREDVILASKVYFNEGHLSKEAIHREIDLTLKNLDTNYLDLYIIHRFDHTTPIAETMEALNDLVKAGKVRYLGASAMYAYQFHMMQNYAKEHNLAQFVSMQNHYNPLYREDEREMIPLCNLLNVGLTPYSPLASGRCARPNWDEQTKRYSTDIIASKKYDNTAEQDKEIVKRIFELSQKYNCTMTQITLAWHLHKSMTSPIVGCSKLHHLEDSLKAVEINLPEEDVNYIDELYLPHKVVGALSDPRK